MGCFMFEVSNDIRNVGNLSEDDLYDHLGELSTDYVQDCSEEDSLRDIFNLMIRLRDNGAETSEENGVPYVIFSQESKRKWFSKKFAQFTVLANRLNLDIFSGAAENTWSILAELNSKIDDKYGDQIYSSDDFTFGSLDDFVRYAEVDIKYYFGPNVVFIR